MNKNHLHSPMVNETWRCSMRMLSAFATVAFLAASPCMAQVVITPGGADAARHEYHADRQEHAAQRDEHKAREDAAMGNYGAAAHEQAKAQDHQMEAQHQEHRADHDSTGGVKVEIGR
jgi:hypothetical protein